MASSHDPRHEELLARLSCDDTGELPAAARAEIESCATCAAQLAGLRRVQRDVRDAAREEREILAEAARAGEVPGVAEAREFARRKSAEARAAVAAPPVRRFAPRWLAAAAAVLVVALGAYFWLAPTKAPRHQTFGPTDAKIEQLSSDGYERFRWRGEVGPGGWFEVEVFAPATDASPRRALTVPPVRVSTGQSWEPPSTMSASWPDEIEWQVRGITIDEQGAGVSEIARAARFRH
jgi:hypothetical protein